MVTFAEEAGWGEIAKQKFERALKSPPVGLLAIELDKGYGENLKEHQIKHLATGGWNWHEQHYLYSWPKATGWQALLFKCGLKSLYCPIKKIIQINAESVKCKQSSPWPFPKFCPLRSEYHFGECIAGNGLNDQWQTSTPEWHKKQSAPPSWFVCNETCFPQVPAFEADKYVPFRWLLLILQQDFPCAFLGWLGNWTTIYEIFGDRRIEFQWDPGTEPNWRLETIAVRSFSLRSKEVHVMQILASVSSHCLLKIYRLIMVKKAGR